jgi:diguanylate cyclase
MESRRKIEQARELGKATMARLEALGLPPTPENYTIWYHDLADSYPDLSKMLRFVEAQEQTYDEEICARVYKKFFGSDQQARLIDETCARMEKAMTQILIQIASASGGTCQYGQVLEGIHTQLAAPDGVSEVRMLVEQRLVETRKMQGRTRELEAALDESTKEISKFSDHLEAAKQQALTDGLTNLANRRHFDEELQSLTDEAASEETPLCLLIGDIDHFKVFNDTHGHRVGDKVLQQVALTIKQCIKGRDLAARYGGEEFAVILPITDIKGAENVAEQIRLSISKKKIRMKSSGLDLGTITMSIGATIYHPGESMAALIERADRGLFEAKRKGRNQVVIRLPDVVSSPPEAPRAVNHRRSRSTGRIRSQATSGRSRYP